MATDPDLMAALQGTHDLEATASERWHKQEHEFKCGKRRVPKLGRWFDRRHKEAYERQHALRNAIIQLGGTVTTTLGDTSYTPDPRQAFEDACELIDQLAASHQDVEDAIKAAVKAADDGNEKTWYRALHEKFHGYAKDLRRIYRKGEHKQQQLEDLGLPLFLHKHS